MILTYFTGKRYRADSTYTVPIPYVFLWICRRCHLVYAANGVSTSRARNQRYIGDACPLCDYDAAAAAADHQPSWTFYGCVCYHNNPVVNPPNSVDMRGQ